MLKFRSKNVISTQPRAHFQLSEDPEFPFVTPQSPIKSAYILENEAVIRGRPWQNTHFHF